MHLIKILITITSPLCILEKKKRSCNHLENMFKHLLEDYKRTKRTLRDKKEISIPLRTIIHGWLDFEA